METVCCICFKKKKGDQWINGLPRRGASVSHGFCPECFELTIRKIERREANQHREPPLAA